MASTYLAPSGLNVKFLGALDIEPAWREVFERKAFLQHGVALRAGDTVLDAHAGPGLFTCLAAELVGRAATLLPDQASGVGRVIACEPFPQTYGVLKENVAGHADFATTAGRGSDVAKVTLLPVGLGDGGATQAEAAYYATVPGLSSTAPDPAEAEGAVLGLLGREEGGSLAPTWLALLQHCSPLLHRMLAGWWVRGSVLGGAERMTVSLSSVSDVMQQEGVSRVDLLRVAAPRGELGILRGIKPSDWPKIRQVVVEVGSPERLPGVRAALEAGNFSSTVEEAFPGGTRVFCSRGPRR